MSAAYFTLPEYLIKKLDRLMADAGKLVLKEITFKKSYDYIIDKCGWKRMRDMSKIESLKLLHYISTQRKPLALSQHFIFPIRTCKQIIAKDGLTKSSCKNVFLFKALPFYNNLGPEIIDTSPSCLKLDLCLLKLKASTSTSSSSGTESINLPLFSVDLCRNWLGLFYLFSFPNS